MRERMSGPGVLGFVLLVAVAVLLGVVLAEVRGCRQDRSSVRLETYTGH
ncbi:hypothetical protein ES703_91710 [subsurface metagenome]